MKKCRIIYGDPLPPARNMQRDRDLLEGLKSDPTPVLHFYQWKGLSATYGHFVRPENWLNLQHAAKLGLQLARRPTGGGILFHTGDLAFSLTIPQHHFLWAPETLQSYHTVNHLILEVVREFLLSTPDLLSSHPLPTCPASRHFCMAKPTIYDVMVHGRKIGGAAQRRTRWGLLHQGSLALTPPSQELLALLPPSVAKAMEQHSHYLIEDCHNVSTVQADIKEALAKRLCQTS